MKKIVAVILCCWLLAVSVPLTAQAAQAGTALSQGRVYTFINTDERTVSYVSFNGSARYEYVLQDAAGDVVDFGVSTGRFAVRGGGETTVSLLNASSASVTYDAAKISVSDTAGAALGRVKAAQGESVTLDNARDSAARIAVDNTGRTEYARYDIAVRDRSGAVTYFADASRYTSLTLPAGGSGTFTPSEGGLDLIYPSVYGSDITANPSDTQALLSVSLTQGKTYTVANASQIVDGEVGVSGGGSLTYDFIRNDKWGYTVDYRHAAKDKRIPVDAGDVLYITPRASVKLVYPADWRDVLSVTEGGAGALTAYTVAAGDTLTIENTDAYASFTFRADPADPVSTLDYTYNGGLYGESDYAMSEAFQEMTVGAGYSWTFTVKKGQALTLWLPAAWLTEGLRVNGVAASALSAHTLRPGQSLRLVNTDTISEYVVSFAGAQAGREAVYDYMIAGGADTLYGADSRQNAQTLPAGGVMIITASKAEPLTVRLPAVPAVTASETSEAAVTRYSLAKGESVLVKNTSGLRAFTLTVQGAAGMGAASLDYVIKDNKGQVADFGGAEAGSPVTVDAGGSALFTNTDTRPMAVAYPQSWLKEGISASKTDAKALYHQTINENTPMDIVNTDKRYARSVNIESVTGAVLPVQYDYVQRSDRSAVIDYGTAGLGSLTVYGGGRTTLMPQKGVSLRVCYPSEWHNNSVKLSAAANAPLYRKVLKPGSRQKLDNRSKNTLEVQVLAGSYYIRYNNDNSRIAADERAESCLVGIPAESSVVITAATGVDLELVMPWEWAKQLGA